jgi:hypothetical protein
MAGIQQRLALTLQRHPEAAQRPRTQRLNNLSNLAGIA